MMTRRASPPHAGDEHERGDRVDERAAEMQAHHVVDVGETKRPSPASIMMPMPAPK